MWQIKANGWLCWQDRSLKKFEKHNYLFWTQGFNVGSVSFCEVWVCLDTICVTLYKFCFISAFLDKIIAIHFMRQLEDKKIYLWAQNISFQMRAICFCMSILFRNNFCSRPYSHLTGKPRPPSTQVAHKKKETQQQPRPAKALTVSTLYAWQPVWTSWGMHFPPTEEK